MNVTLISHTDMPTTTCARAARTCTSVHPWAEYDPDKLLRRVLDMGHESIAEHASFTFVIEGISRACSHQLVRYRHASYAQQSQRYVKLSPDCASHEWYVMPDTVQGNRKTASRMARAMQEVREAYHDLLAEGVPAEDARFVLPNAACTNITVTLNAAELRHMMRQRLCNRAQWEIRALVGEMAELARGVAPVLFEGVGPACLSGECPEGKRSCGKPPKAEV